MNISHLTVPILITDRSGKALLKNRAFLLRPFPLTTHPLSYLRKHDRQAVDALRNGECRILCLTSPRSEGPLLLLRREEQLIFFFSPVLKRQLFFESAMLDVLLSESLAPILIALLDKKITDATAIAEALTLQECFSLPLTAGRFASVASLTLRLLLEEDALVSTLTPEEKEDQLTSSEEAFLALGHLADRLSDFGMNKDDPPPITLLCENESLLFSTPVDRILIGRLALPLRVEIVSPFTFRKSDARQALLLATLFEMLRTSQPKIHQIIT